MDTTDCGEKETEVFKNPGKLNPADLVTKHLDATTVDGHLEKIALEIMEGRAIEAPKLHLVMKEKGTREDGSEGLCKYVKMVIAALAN